MLVKKKSASTEANGLSSLILKNDNGKVHFMLPPKWLYFLLLLVAFELVADILAKQFSLNGKLIFAVLAMLGFVAANLAWLVSLRTGAELSKGAVLFSVLSGIGAVLIGVLIYHEKANPYQLIGLALGIIAIAFLSVE
jgi:multidrug transporter EmrE-like cation transporter